MRSTLPRRPHAPRRPAGRSHAAGVLLAVGGLLAALLVAPPASAEGGPGIGFDISWPQCSSRTSSTSAPLPQGAAFGIVGVNNGRPITGNPCFTEQYAWAATTTPKPPAFYVNTANPVGVGETWGVDPTPRPCSGAADDAGCAYDYGYFAARDAVQRVDAAGVEVRPLTWWLDVEVGAGGNKWRGDAAGLPVNRAVLAGYVDGMRTRPDRVGTLGIYTNINLWKQVTGQVGGQPAAPATDGLPLWYPVGSDGQAKALEKCALTPTPNAGPVVLVQWVTRIESLGRSFDHDQACGPDTVKVDITAVKDGGVAGSQVAVAGVGTPGTAVTLSVIDPFTAEKPVRVVVPDSKGVWSASFALGTNALLTARDDSSEASRPLAVAVKIGTVKVRGAGVDGRGLCRTRLDGTTFPFQPGQQAIVRGRLDKQVAYANVRKKGGSGTWTTMVMSRCGARADVKVTVAGVIRPSGLRFATDGRAGPVVLNPRR